MYTVGQLSKKTNVSIRTLHYYDEIGLLHLSEKAINGYRYYTKDDMVKLQQILVLKELGFKLSQIKGMIQVDNNKTKTEKWKQTFEMEIEKIQEEKKRLDEMEKSLHAVLHSLELTGDVTVDYIVDIIRSVQREYVDSFLYQNFTDEEQAILLEKMPNLMTHNERTNKWIRLLKKVHQTKDEPVESVASQTLAREIMEFIREDLQIEDSLIDKYWEKIKPENGKSEKVLGLDKETMDYIEGILDWYENNSEGSKEHEK